MWKIRINYKEYLWLRITNYEYYCWRIIKLSRQTTLLICAEVILLLKHPDRCILKINQKEIFNFLSCKYLIWWNKRNERARARDAHEATWQPETLWAQNAQESMAQLAAWVIKSVEVSNEMRKFQLVPHQGLEKIPKRKRNIKIYFFNQLIFYKTKLFIKILKITF